MKRPMLTEEMLAATLSALEGVKRLILVGDHRQLPPIGAGRLSSTWSNGWSQVASRSQHE